MAKAAFNMKKILFTSNWNLGLRKKLVKCYNFSIVRMLLKYGLFGE
jgi:hypothetical protein